MIMANLYYIIGASGSGKDSLIQYIRENIPDEAPVVFAHRYITRRADAGGENHVALRIQEFLLRDQHECFAMKWYSHDTYYGVGVEVNKWLDQGLDVIVNGSREYLTEASQRYSNLVPILISVDREVLHDRLIARGRETDEQINKRLIQAERLDHEVNHPDLLKLGNNSSIEEAGRHLLNLILDKVREQCA